MYRQVLAKGWCDKSKAGDLEAVGQYEFLGLEVGKPGFRAYQNGELYVPSPTMIKQPIYRIRSPHVRACVMLAVEIGATREEVWGLRWNDMNLTRKPWWPGWGGATA